MAETDQPTTKSPPPKTIREGITHINTTVRDQLPNKNADTIRIMEFVVGLNETRRSDSRTCKGEVIL